MKGEIKSINMSTVLLKRVSDVSISDNPRRGWHFIVHSRVGDEALLSMGGILVAQLLDSNLSPSFSLWINLGFNTEK